MAQEEIFSHLGILIMNFCLLSYTVAVAVSFFSCGDPDPNSDPAFTKLLNTDSICIWIRIHNTAFRPFYCENF